MLAETPRASAPRNCGQFAAANEGPQRSSADSLRKPYSLWGGEFGRTPAVELPTPGSNAGKQRGRDHNHYGFTVWMAGGGIKGGQTYGATDEFGFQAVENPMHVRDLHATMLAALGFNHETFTSRYAGLDFRLTNVTEHAKVIKELLA